MSLEDALNLIGGVLALVATLGGCYVAYLMGASALRHWRRARRPTVAATSEVAELRLRVAELEATRDRMMELEERVDFAERALARERELSRLPSARGD